MQSQLTPPRRRRDGAPMLTAAELVAQSDFARLDPRRARELLDRTADPLTESHDGDGD